MSKWNLATYHWMGVRKLAWIEEQLTAMGIEHKRESRGGNWPPCIGVCGDYAWNKAFLFIETVRVKGVRLLVDADPDDPTFDGYIAHDFIDGVIVPVSRDTLE